VGSHHPFAEELAPSPLLSPLDERGLHEACSDHGKKKPRGNDSQRRFGFPQGNLNSRRPRGPRRDEAHGTPRHETL
jgi:hypothetical protein